MSAPTLWLKAAAYNLSVPPVPNSLTRALLARAQPRPRPWLLNVAGTVASGKSTLVERLLPRLGPGVVAVQFDRIMEAYDGYRADVKAKGAEAAFAAWEPAAWAAGFALMAELTWRRCPFILELSASHPSHPAFLEAFPRHGYAAAMVVLSTPPAVCEARLRERSENGGRHVPPHYLEERHARLATLVPRYREIVGRFVETAADGSFDEAALLSFLA